MTAASPIGVTEITVAEDVLDTLGPEPVSNVVATAGSGNGSVSISWDASPSTDVTFHRISDADGNLMGLTEYDDLDLALSGLPVGETMQFIVQAFSDAFPSEGVASNTVTIDGEDAALWIKPGDVAEPLDVTSQWGVSVFIAGSASLDVDDIDVSTISVGPGQTIGIDPLHQPKTRAQHTGDYNSDGYPDLEVRADIQDAGMTPTLDELCLNAQLTSGEAINACVEIVHDVFRP